MPPHSALSDTTRASPNQCTSMWQMSSRKVMVAPFGVAEASISPRCVEGQSAGLADGQKALPLTYSWPPRARMRRLLSPLCQSPAQSFSFGVANGSGCRCVLSTQPELPPPLFGKNAQRKRPMSRPVSTVSPLIT
ncbi:hypothetical protein D3C77_507380 [compost metagenome]